MDLLKLSNEEKEKAVFDLQSKNYDARLKCTFSNPVRIIVKRKEIIRKTVCLYFFKSNKGAGYSYRKHPRKGYYVSQSMWEFLYKIEPEKPKTSIKNNILYKFHPNLWDDLKERIIRDPSYLDNKDLTIHYLNQIFSKDVLREFSKAVENKESYRNKIYGEKRDRTLSAEMGKDGIYRAWYSSEYSGEGNGDYYIVLSPKIYSFKETD